jgi:hypothetical protein
VASALAVTTSLRASDKEEIAIIGKDVTPPSIVVAEQATPAEEFAAEELQLYVEKITGTRLKVIKSDETPKENAIILGSHPANESLDWKSLDPDSFKIDVQAGLVRIAGGKVFQDDGKTPFHERGTLYGVYELLDKWGVRWYRPDDLGEYVPRLAKLSLPTGLATHHPGYLYRYGLKDYTKAGTAPPEERRTADLWSVRHHQNVGLNMSEEMHAKVGRSFLMNSGHAYEYLVSHKQYFKEHPEYFALIDGKRSEREDAQLCLSNPDVQRIATEAVIAQTRNKLSDPRFLVMYSVEPNDGSLWCECEACQAMDDPKLKTPSGLPSMSNRVAKFGNLIAAKVREVTPTANVMWLAYNQHSEAPTLVEKFEPNTVIWMAPYASTYSDWSNRLEDPESTQNANFLKSMKGFGEKSRLMVYEYFGGYSWGGPMPSIGMVSDRLSTYRKYGAIGVYVLMSSPHWGPQGLPYYIAARMLWDPDMDVGKEVDLYYKNFYGPAEKPMRAYHELMEKAASTSCIYFGSGGYKLEDLFTDELLNSMAPHLRDAEEAVKGLEPYQKRLAGVAAGFEYAKRMREYENLKAKADFAAAAKVLQGLLDYTAADKRGEIFAHERISETWDGIRRELKKTTDSAELFGSLQGPKVASDLTTKWDFQVDPKEEGDKAGWMMPEFKTEGWATLDTNTWWQNQGYPDYYGVAWYRKPFTTPLVKEGRRTVVSFGAVDGDATVFVNGKKVAERALTPTGDNWDKPFYVDISDALAQNGKNLLVVRVDKRTHFCGIFKPVKLMTADSILAQNE